MWYFHSSGGLTQGCIASLRWRFQMTALPDRLTARHPVICIMRMSNTLSSQQRYLRREAFLVVGARRSCVSTLNFAVKCELGLNTMLQTPVRHLQVIQSTGRPPSHQPTKQSTTIDELQAHSLALNI